MSMIYLYAVSANIVFGYFSVFPEMVASSRANGGSPKKGAIHRLSLGGVLKPNENVLGVIYNLRLHRMKGLQALATETPKTPPG